MKASTRIPAGRNTRSDSKLKNLPQRQEQIMHWLRGPATYQHKILAAHPASIHPPKTPERQPEERECKIERALGTLGLHPHSQDHPRLDQDYHALTGNTPALAWNSMQPDFHP